MAIGTVIVVSMVLLIGFILFITESSNNCNQNCNQGRNCNCGINRQSKEK